MTANPEQIIVFTGLDGSLIQAAAADAPEILPALELLRSRDIPLILTTIRPAAEALPLAQGLDGSDPLIVEHGAAIYVPKGALKLDLQHQRVEQGYLIIEIGLGRGDLVGHLVHLREEFNFLLWGYSELTPEQAAEMGATLTGDDLRAAQPLEYMEPVVYLGPESELIRVQEELENRQLRWTPLDGRIFVTGDHDPGIAVRLLIQFYREAFPDRDVKSIGLGDSILDAAMLHAVDQPVLVRRPDGGFDQRVGRRGLLFTKHSDGQGWSQAVIALVTHDKEA